MMLEKMGILDNQEQWNKVLAIIPDDSIHDLN